MILGAFLGGAIIALLQTGPVRRLNLVRWHEAKVDAWLMRILPLPLVLRDATDDELLDLAFRASRVTHGSAEAQIACALYALIVRRLLSGAEDRAAVLVDARDAARFRGEAEPIDPVAGHIPGARNLPFGACLGADGTWEDSEALRRRLESMLGDDDSAPWAVMCGSGVTACHDLLAMEIAGLHGARLYAGSWSEWIRDPQRPIATGN